MLQCLGPFSFSPLFLHVLVMTIKSLSASSQSNYCKCVFFFRWGKFDKTFHMGVIFMHISFIKVYGFYFYVEVIFARQNCEKRENYPYTKISAFTVLWIPGTRFNSYIFPLSGYMKNVHRKHDKVIFVHCPEYHTVVQSRKYGGICVLQQLI